MSDTLAGQVGQKEPYTATPQSMYFNYKYIPNGNDVGVAYFQLTYWDATGDSAITVAEVFDTLNATNGWQEKNLTFTTVNGGTPDSLNIIFFASAGPALGGPAAGWPTAKPGTVLHIDRIYSDLQLSVKETTVNDIEFESYVVDRQLIIKTQELNSSIEMYNMSGQLILTENITANQMMFSVNELPTGVYLVRLKTENGFKTNKVVVK